MAKFTEEKEYTARGLDPTGKLIGAWCDNCDLNVSTPNGTRQTHAMVDEWRQQKEDQGVNHPEELVIPHLSREDMKGLKLSELCPV